MQSGFGNIHKVDLLAAPVTLASCFMYCIISSLFVEPTENYHPSLQPPSILQFNI